MAAAREPYFRYADLEAWTDGFAVRLGAGGFGEVYRGRLPDGTAVAVKRIMGDKVKGNELKAVGDLVREAGLMDAAAREAAAADTPGLPLHLVPLLGVCLPSVDAPQLCLVTPFMVEGSLADHIGRPGGKLATGRLRVAAARDVALGVAALHARRPRMLHLDIKPENILLDGELCAYVSDYGLSREVNDSFVISKLHGTSGYCAPEIHAKGQYSAKVRA